MANEPQPGLLIISIDLDSRALRGSLETRLSHEAVIKAIAPVFARHQVSATWAFGDPSASSALGRLLSVVPSQEVALLAESHWLGGTTTRGDLARGLSQRLNDLHALGQRSTTLAFVEGELGKDWDLAVKYGITALCHLSSGESETSSPVRGRQSPASRQRAYAQPRAVRFGLWDFPAAMNFPVKSGFFALAAASLRARQGIDRAIAEQGVFHLVIDGLEYCAGGSGVQRVLERVLQHVDRRRQQGVLQSVSIGEAATQLSRPRQSTPAHSILRPTPLAA